MRACTTAGSTGMICQPLASRGVGSAKPQSVPPEPLMTAVMSGWSPPQRCSPVRAQVKELAPGIFW